MAVRQYVGARYVPKFYQNSKNPLSAEWEGNKAYEALTIVQYNNSSYTSKIPVPAGIGNPAQNPTYWVNTGDYNAQVEEYRQNTINLQNNVDSFNAKLNTETAERKEADESLNATITKNANTIANLEIPTRLIPGGILIGHRGCGFAPENTRESFRCGLNWGYDGIEGDLNYTKDHYLVMMHDDEISRYTNDGSGSIKDIPYDVARTYNYNKNYESTYNTGTLCDLRNFISIAKHYSKYCEIDIANRGVNSVLSDAVNLVKQLAYVDKTIFACDQNNYKIILDLLPLANITISCYSVSNAIEISKEVSKRTNRYSISINYNADTYGNYLNLGFPVKFWTINDVATISALYNNSVTEIITDTARTTSIGAPLSFTSYNHRVSDTQSDHGLLRTASFNGGFIVTGFIKITGVPDGGTILTIHTPLLTSIVQASNFGGLITSYEHKISYGLAFEYTNNHINVAGSNIQDGTYNIFMIFLNNIYHNCLFVSDQE